MGDGSAVIPDESGGGSSSLSSSISVSDSASKQERVHHLDQLIAKGDWAGIVAAAGKYQAIDDQGTNPTEEEREALAQASMWQEIANQSKQSADAQQGAVDAADWAIDRAKLSLDQQTAGTTDDVASSEAKRPRLEDEDESV